jgi:competence CoiA-like predicted nuclease
MKYAIVNGTKTDANKGVKGICPSCGSELIVKCGERKINHWSHKGIRNCDPLVGTRNRVASLLEK